MCSSDLERKGSGPLVIPVLGLISAVYSLFDARFRCHFQSRVTTESLWMAEKNILPPVETSERPLRSLDATTVSVSGIEVSRFHPGDVAWDEAGRFVTERSDGVQSI